MSAICAQNLFVQAIRDSHYCAQPEATIHAKRENVRSSTPTARRSSVYHSRSKTLAQSRRAAIYRRARRTLLSSRRACLRQPKNQRLPRSSSARNYTSAGSCGLSRAAFTVPRKPNRSSAVAQNSRYIIGGMNTTRADTSRAAFVEPNIACYSER